MNVEFKIDEDFLLHLHKQIMGLCEFLKREGEILINKDEDIFYRYLSHSRIKAILLAYKCTMEVACDSFVSGHNLNHPFLQTEKAKENSWDKIKLEEDPFFCRANENPEDELKNIIEKALLDSLNKSRQ